MKQQLIDEEKVLSTMQILRVELRKLPLNPHERIVALQNLLAHEQNVLERQNMATLMFNSLNKV